MTMLAELGGSAFCAGIVLGTASILSIGPNNLMLIREGLMRGRVALVASVIWASYAVLLAGALVLGDRIAAAGAVIRPVLSWLGLGALCWFAFLSLRACATATSSFQEARPERESVARCVRRTLTIVWCNPLTYVERLLLPASVSCSFLLPSSRLPFVAGLLLTATISCYGYSFGAGLLASRLRRQNTQRVFDLGSGVILSVLAVIMATGLIARP